MIVRSVRPDDLDPLFELIQKSEFGLTTLKVSKDVLATRIEESVFAFSRKSTQRGGHPYVFVMEDSESQEIVGTCAIYSKVGGFEPFYSYEIKTSVHSSEDLGVHKEIATLHLREEHNGPTEIGSLFLSPTFWGQGHGGLLSMSRFLFMAQFPNLFEEEVIAEMRGVVDSDGKSPLWAALGSYFFQMEFPKAETLTSKSKKFIAELMPRHPIYIPLLPEDAQEVIGKVHDFTKPALAMLEKEGFEFRQLVDIFDGGPSVHCALSEIQTVRTSQVANVAAVQDVADDVPKYLLSNCSMDFRCCKGSAIVEGQSVTLSPSVARNLSVKVGDSIRWSN